MIRFLLGLVVGVVIGAVAVAPNPELSERVRVAWDEGRRWAVGFFSDAEGVAGEAVDRAREAAGEALGKARDAAGDVADEVQEETAR